MAKTVPDVDFYSFQEVFDTKEDVKQSHETRADIWEELSQIFLGYHRFYYPVMSGRDDSGEVPYSLTTGSGMFIKGEYKVDSEGDYFTYRRRFAPIQIEVKDEPVNLQYASIVTNGQTIHIYNFHGIWFPGDKLDTPERIEQSEKIIGFMKKAEGPKILCGDFNLMPETKSIALLASEYRNLIKKFNIGTTRSSLNTYRGTEFEQKFADYVFVSNDVKVKSFSVPEVEISDHLPLILEFDI